MTRNQAADWMPRGSEEDASFAMMIKNRSEDNKVDEDVAVVVKSGPP